jgi:hypothetical protein
MLRRAAELHCAAPFEVVHCRSYIPAIVGRRLQRRHGLRFLFDMRGFWPEEKVDGGHWPQSNPLFRAVYRWFKGREAEFLENADHVVSLTRAGERELLARPGNRLPPERISVIPAASISGILRGRPRRRGSPPAPPSACAPMRRFLCIWARSAGIICSASCSTFCHLSRAQSGRDVPVRNTGQVGT